MINGLQIAFSLFAQSSLVTSSSNNNTRNSALVNAIQSDVLHELNNKCDGVQNKIDFIIENTVVNIITNPSTSFLTQQSAPNSNFPDPTHRGPH